MAANVLLVVRITERRVDAQQNQGPRPRTEVAIIDEGQGGTAAWPQLDGIRAFAVLGVMFFHAGVSWARGGLLGVDVFFVLSGFLITTLLCREYDRTGTIALAAFWARRARRLLPALLVLLLGVALYAHVYAVERRGQSPRGRPRHPDLRGQLALHLPTRATSPPQAPSPCCTRGPSRSRSSTTSSGRWSPSRAPLARPPGPGHRGRHRGPGLGAADGGHATHAGVRSIGCTTAPTPGPRPSWSDRSWRYRRRRALGSWHVVSERRRRRVTTVRVAGIALGVAGAGYLLWAWHAYVGTNAALLRRVPPGGAWPRPP